MRRSVILLIASALVFAACGGDDSDDSGAAQEQDPAAEDEDDDEPAPAGETTTITFWNGFTDADRPFVEEIVNRFNESQDDVVVEMTVNPWDVLIPSLVPAYAAGEGPTIVGLGADQFPGMVEQGVWAPVDNMYDSGMLDPATLAQANLESTTYQGAQYGAPMASAAGMLYYNKDLFAGAGLDGPPETMDQLAEYAVTLTEIDPDDETNSQYGIALSDHAGMNTWAVLLWANGGGIVSDDNSRSILGDPASVEAAEFWTDLIINENISPVGMSGVEGDQLFIAGRAGMVMSGPWVSTAFTDAGIDYGVAPMPPGQATQAADAVSVNMHVNAEATDAETAAAYEFMTFWNSEDSQIYWAVNAGFPPNRTDVPASAVAENPTSAAFSEAVGARVYLEGLTQAAQINTDIFIPTIQRMTRGEGTPEELLTDAAEQIDALLDQ